MPPLPIEYNEEEQEVKQINETNDDSNFYSDNYESPIAMQEDLEYAKFSKDAYEDRNNRNDFGDFKYKKSLSTDKYATYMDEDDIVIGVRGTSSKSKVDDFLINSSLAAGSFGGQYKVNSVIKPIQREIRYLQFKYPNKQITLTGHSQAGALVSELGVLNPSVEVKAFNRAVGLPFISSQVQCSIFGCNNVKSYRINGDFASSAGTVLPSIGNTFNLAPKIPDIETQLESKTAASFALPEDMYAAHSIRNFIDRDGKLIPDKNIYGRVLARRLGTVAGLVAPAVLPTFVDKLFPQKSLLKKIPNTNKFKILKLSDTNIPERAKQKLSKVNAPRIAIDKISNKLGGANSFLKYGIAGGIGDYAGLLYYNEFMDYDEDTEEF